MAESFWGDGMESLKKVIVIMLLTFVNWTQNFREPSWVPNLKYTCKFIADLGHSWPRKIPKYNTCIL